MWWKYCQYKKIKLSPLELEAIKYDNFNDFEFAYLGDIKHGRYFHVTDNPNFNIDPNYAPRDMSSMATGPSSNKGMMITSDLDLWLFEFPERQYVAEIDMSNVNPKDYYQVKRGFGNEFWVTPEGVAKAKVIRVFTRKNALQSSHRYFNRLPESSEGLRNIWELAHQKIQKNNALMIDEQEKKITKIKENPQNNMK